MEFFIKLKQIKTLNKDEKKETINELILYICLMILLPLMVAHLFFLFNNLNIHMPFWFEWFSFILCAFSFFACGRLFFIYSIEEIFKWKFLGMNTLITIASWVAFIYSCYQIISNTIFYVNNHHIMNHSYDFSHTAAMIVTIVLFGETISVKLKKKTNYDLEQISKLQSKTCFLYDEKSKQSKEVDTSTINIGDLILVQKGTIIPIDGIVFQNETDIDESSLTGESKPIHKKINSIVMSGTYNLTSTFILKATSNGENTIVKAIIENVNKISQQKPKYLKIVDRVSRLFTPIIIILAILAFLLHAFVPNINSISGTFNEWFNIEQTMNMNKYGLALFYAVGTLSIACPCALGLAAPVATLVGASKAAKNGILINNVEAYEKIKKIDAIAFDKTGTLTEGKFSVSNILGDTKNMDIIYSLEKNSIHPIAISFVEYYEKKLNKNNILDLSEVNEIPGIGLTCKWNNKSYSLMSYQQAINNNYNFDDELLEFKKNYDEQDEDNMMQTIVCLIENDKVINIIVFQDKLNENTIDAINLFKAKNIKVLIISGDNDKTVSYIAKKLNIDEYYANIKPEEKANIIKELQKKYKNVAYVGDGINDLVALKQSDLSIAISKDNNVAQSISDISILNKDILTIVKAIHIIKETRRMIIFNLFWAFAYNIITLPLSIIGFIPPFIGVFIMATSDITVIANSLFFKFKKVRYISKKEVLKLNNKKISPYLKN